MKGWTAADDIKARLTPDHFAYATAVLEALSEVEFRTDADEAVVVWMKGYKGELQPVIWPLHLHKHGPDCFRA